MDYVDRLTELRTDNDLGQADIPKLLGCQQSAVSKYELRKVPYRIADVIALCKYYNVSADYLFGLPENMPYPKRRK